MTILTWMHLIIHEYLIDFSMVSIILHGFQGACSAQQNFLPCFPSFLPSFLPSLLPSSPSSPSLPFLSFSFLFLSFPPTSCYCFYIVFFWSGFLFLIRIFFLDPEKIVFNPSPQTLGHFSGQHLGHEKPIPCEKSLESNYYHGLSLKMPQT